MLCFVENYHFPGRLVRRIEGCEHKKSARTYSCARSGLARPVYASSRRLGRGSNEREPGRALDRVHYDLVERLWVAEPPIGPGDKEIITDEG